MGPSEASWPRLQPPVCDGVSRLGQSKADIALKLVLQVGRQEQSSSELA